MPEPVQAIEPFKFYTRLNLPELTGLKAATIAQLLELIRRAPGACIYHHTHHFLQQHQYLSPEPPNDFAYWITEVLGEDELGERLASIDTIQFFTIAALRDKFVDAIEEYLKANLLAQFRFAREGEEFHFIKSLSFVLPTNYVAYNLREFVEALKKVTVDSIYFHVFEARLRLERGSNDFASWIETAIGDGKLADKLSRLDPYSYTLEELRQTIITLIEARLAD